MKIFLDSANLEEVRQAVSLGIIDGVTTNPSLIAKEGVPLEEQIRRLCDICSGDISASVMQNAAEEMIREGLALAAIRQNVVVKLPLTPEGIRATKTLSNEGVRVNVTLCFSAAQALLAAKAGAYIVSPFLGRVDDLGFSGIEMVRDILTIYQNSGYATQVLAASIRGPLHFAAAAKAGAHIATVPLKILEQLFEHPLTDKGLQQFASDHARAFHLAKTC